MTMKNLISQLEALQEKQTWLRKGLKDWLEIWAENTLEIEGEYLAICGLSDYMAVDIDYYIVPGSSELYTGCCQAVSHQGTDSLDIISIDSLDINNVRLIVQHIPKRIVQYANTIQSDIKKIDDMMKALLP